MLATINTDKPLAGYKSNAYLIFDYQGKHDFKFAGLNVALNKLQIGHRDARGWVVDAQIPLNIKVGVDYNFMLAINGTIATISVLGTKTSLGHTFAPRMIGGKQYGLNTGMVGVGAENSRGRFDNVVVQVPADFTYIKTNDFATTSQPKLVAASGEWSTTDERYVGTTTPIDSRAISLVDLGLDSGLDPSGRLELEAVMSFQSQAGFVFDYYSPTHFKFAIFSPETDEILFGHVDERRGWTIDARVSFASDADVDYRVKIALKGTVATVLVNDQVIASHAFFSPIVDGSFGALVAAGGVSYDEFTVRSDDARFKSSTAGASTTSTTTTTTTAMSSSATTDSGVIQQRKVKAVAYQPQPLRTTAPTPDSDLIDDELDPLLA